MPVGTSSKLWVLTPSTTLPHSKKTKPNPAFPTLAPLGQVTNMGIIAESLVFIFFNQSLQTHTFLSRPRPSPSSELSYLLSEPVNYPLSSQHCSLHHLQSCNTDRSSRDKIGKIPSPPHTPPHLNFFTNFQLP